MKPEAQARQQIDALLTQADWVVQVVNRFNLGAARGIAIAEFPLSTGPTDYLLVVDRQAVGMVEAKKVGETLADEDNQSARYREGHPGAPGYETCFITGLDLDPQRRSYKNTEARLDRECLIQLASDKNHFFCGREWDGATSAEGDWKTASDRPAEKKLDTVRPRYPSDRCLKPA